MSSPVAGTNAAELRTAITVMKSSVEPVLCPFFGKCDGIVILDSAGGIKEFHPNKDHTPSALCDLIVLIRPDRLVCGYVGGVERRRLRDAGIDVRLGTCAASVHELHACFCDLSEA